MHLVNYRSVKNAYETNWIIQGGFSCCAVVE